jgi:hypothetical protein
MSGLGGFSSSNRKNFLARSDRVTAALGGMNFLLLRCELLGSKGVVDRVRTKKPTRISVRGGIDAFDNVKTNDL